jgi:LPXTG-site transpeptidase (sortase) family protein
MKGRGRLVLNYALIVAGALVVVAGGIGLGRLAYDILTTESELAAVMGEDESGFVPLIAPERTGCAACATEVAAAESDATQAAALTQGATLPPQAATLPTPTPTPVVGLVPEHLSIPSINLEAPIRPVDLGFIELAGRKVWMWRAPKEFAAGWHSTSARLGQVGNMVLNGHHNIHGEVFRYLEDVKEGDLVVISAGSFIKRFIVTEIHLLPERWQPLEVRLENAKWIEPTRDERVTLVSCWPYTSNTHRLVIVAKPIVEPAATDEAP